MADCGLEIGAHTVTHPQLDTLPARAVRRELQVPKAVLEEQLGLPVPAFAYPHGYNSPAVRRLVREAGYTSATAVRNALSSTRDDPYRIARLMLKSTDTTADLAFWLDGWARRWPPTRTGCGRSAGGPTAAPRPCCTARSSRASRSGAGPSGTEGQSRCARSLGSSAVTVVSEARTSRVLVPLKAPASISAVDASTSADRLSITTSSTFCPASAPPSPVSSRRPTGLSLGGAVRSAARNGRSIARPGQNSR